MNSRFGARTLARSQALQLIFQAEANGLTVEEVLAGDYALEDGPLDDFGRDLALGADALRHDLDAIISTRSATWSLQRMPAVDRNLLRLALYEMMHVDEVGISVTINEYVELAKAYGTDESSKYVNGVLGRVADDLEVGSDVVAHAREQMAIREEAERAEAERRAAEDAERAAQMGYDEDYDEGYYYDDDYADEKPEPHESLPYGADMRPAEGEPTGTWIRRDEESEGEDW